MSAQTARSHLLAIDHDAALRALYEDLFAAVGFQVTVAEPPVTVMDVRAVAPDLVLLDWLYPWSEPPALLRTMRQNHDLAVMPAIVTTTAPERTSVNRLEDPCTRVLTKPFTVEQVVDMANALLVRARTPGAPVHDGKHRPRLGQER